MTPKKWQVRKVRGYWTVIPPDGESLPGYVYVRTMGGYPFGVRPESFTIAWDVLRMHLDPSWALRQHLDRRRT